MEGRQSQIYLQEIWGLRKVTKQNAFLETTPGTFYLAKQFDAKAILLQKSRKMKLMNSIGNSERESMMSLKTKWNSILHPIWEEKKNRQFTNWLRKNNKIHVINDTDKNLGPENADKSDGINKRKRQLFDFLTYSKFSKTEMESF